MKALLLKLWGALRLSKPLQLFFMRILHHQFLIGVTGIFLDDQNRVLLFRHTYRTTDRWSLPGGYIHAKEHPREALEREVKEESNLIVSADYRLKVRTDRESARLDLIYVGRYIGGTFKPSDEVKDAQVFAFEELPQVPDSQLRFIHRALTTEKLETD